MRFGVKVANAEAADRILRACDLGQLRRHTWGNQDIGEPAWEGCLLGAAVPGAISVEDISEAGLMPFWMAELTIKLFDELSMANLEVIGRKYAELIRIWDILTESDWEAIRSNWRFYAVKDHPGNDWDLAFTQFSGLLRIIEKQIGVCNENFA